MQSTSMMILFTSRSRNSRPEGSRRTKRRPWRSSPSRSATRARRVQNRPCGPSSSRDGKGQLHGTIHRYPPCDESLSTRACPRIAWCRGRATTLRPPPTWRNRLFNSTRPGTPAGAELVDGFSGYPIRRRLRSAAPASASATSAERTGTHASAQSAATATDVAVPGSRGIAWDRVRDYVDQKGTDPVYPQQALSQCKVKVFREWLLAAMALSGAAGDAAPVVARRRESRTG